MPIQQKVISRWHDIFSARVKLPGKCAQGLCVASSNTVQTSRRLRPKTKRAMQGESVVRAQRDCEGN